MTIPTKTQTGFARTLSKTVHSRLLLKISLIILVIIAFFSLTFYFFSGKDKSRSSALSNLALDITSAPTVIPTPTPLLGPGSHACDILGICNIYDNPENHECPKTFADPHCLGECGDKKVRCPK